MQQASSTVLRLRGLPFRATQDDIGNFFDGFNFTSVLLSSANGRPSGEAYVEFSSVQVAQRAMDARQRAMLGQRYIELFNSSKEEMKLVAAGENPKAAQKGNAKGGNHLPGSGVTDAGAKGAAGSKEGAVGFAPPGPLEDGAAQNHDQQQEQGGGPGADVAATEAPTSPMPEAPDA